MANTEQPKKTKSAYFLWLEENRSAIVASLGPEEKATAVFRKAGEQWKVLSAELKKPFEEKAATLKAEYEETLQSFKESGGVVTRKSKKDREEKKNKKGKKDPAAPKKAAGGGYGVYMAEHRAEITKGLPAGHKITDVTKVGGARWKALSEAEQKPYSDKFKVKQEEYKVAFAEYKAAGGGDDNEADTITATSPPAKAPKKRAAEESATKEAKVKTAKKGKFSKGAAQNDAVKLDQDVLEAAQQLKMEGALKNLANRSQIVALNLPANKILEALKSAEGLVNKAQSALMGA